LRSRLTERLAVVDADTMDRISGSTHADIDRRWLVRAIIRIKAHP